MAKLQFESLEELQTAFDSQAGRRVLEDAGTVVDAEESAMIIVDDETVRYQEIPEHLSFPPYFGFGSALCHAT